MVRVRPGPPRAVLVNVGLCVKGRRGFCVTELRLCCIMPFSVE